MLNNERRENYLNFSGSRVLTAGQRRRVKRKRRAHSHGFPGERCDRCRMRPKLADPLETRASADPDPKWARS